MAEKKALAKIVGSENMFDDPAVLQEYSADMSFARPVMPTLVVKPANADEVKRIVTWANETSTPLVPVSSGPPHFRGDTVPSTGGSVVVDCSGMRGIIRIDRRNRLVMVEPGVTFGELIPALAKEDLAPLMPLVPRGSKSVVTSFLEREPIIMPRFHWDAQDPLLCTELIYGSGDLFRTGSAAGPGTIEEQWAVGRAQIRGMGPSQIDFTRLLQGAQGTMGIVTWATVKCRPLPKIKKTALIGSADLQRLIDFTYKVLWKKLGEDLLILNHSALSAILGNNNESIVALRDTLPEWILVYSIEGPGLLPQERVEYQYQESVEVAQSFGLELQSVIGGVRAEEVSEVISRPSEEPYWKIRFKGGCEDLFFITTLDRSPGFVSRVYELTGQYRYAAQDMGIYIQPTVQGVNCHCEFNFFYNSQVQKEADKVEQFVKEASEHLVNIGAFFSRPYGSWAKVAYGREAQTIIALRKVKRIFDPNWIMNPGKLCF
jgi:FAD/FMN-containing dehydrogenase